MKRTIDKHGYERGNIQHSDLIHRQIAYKEIYLKNRDKYPKRFSEYQIHHKDGNKRNNHVDNLQIVTREEHEKIHKWDLKKQSANRKDFSTIRLLVGDKITDLIYIATKWSLYLLLFSVGIALIIGFIFGLSGNFEAIKANFLQGYTFLVIFVIFAVSFLAFFSLIGFTLLLGTVGWVYNHFGNLVDETRKRLNWK